MTYTVDGQTKPHHSKLCAQSQISLDISNVCIKIHTINKGTIIYNYIYIYMYVCVHIGRLQSYTDKKKHEALCYINPRTTDS